MTTVDEARAALRREWDAPRAEHCEDCARRAGLVDALITAVRTEGSGVYWLGKAEGRAEAAHELAALREAGDRLFLAALPYLGTNNPDIAAMRAALAATPAEDASDWTDDYAAGRDIRDSDDAATPAEDEEGRT